MMKSSAPSKIAVIGAGLAGLTVARALNDLAEVMVFEKSRGVAGRMSTRYSGAYEFDHGAQYFTATDPDFADFVRNQINDNLVSEWRPEFNTDGAAHIPQHRKYVATPRMNSLCKELARKIETRLSTEIQSVSKNKAGWVLVDSSRNSIGPFDWVISSAPAPQTLRLLPDEFSGRAALNRVRMEACFTLMLGFEEPVATPWQAARFDKSLIEKIAVNSSKPGRESKFSMVLQSTNQWAEVILDQNPIDVQSALIQEAERLLDCPLKGAEHRDLQRWRYAATPEPARVDCLIDDANRLAACGDWCLGSTVEAAFLSAQRLARLLVSRLGSG